MNKEELNKLIDFIELRITMRKVDNSNLSYEETQLIKLCKTCSDLLKENKELKEQLEKKYEKVGTLTTEILYEENKELHNKIDKAMEYIKKYQQIYDIDGSIEKQIDEFNILASPKRLLEILKDGDVNE